MKKTSKFLSALLFMAVAALFVSTAIAAPVLPVYGALLSSSIVIDMPKGSAFMGLQVEIWQRDVVNNLFKNNEFALRCKNVDQFVLAGKVVHIPVAGAPATIKKNLTSFPQTAVTRTDSELTYALDTYFALPRQIQDIEKYENSYDKRQSVVGEDTAQLIQSAMDGLLYRWAPAATNVVECIGAANTDLIDMTATGTRNGMNKEAFDVVAKKFAQANLTGQKMTALLTANHYHQFFNSLSEGEKTNFGAFADPKTGIVGKYKNIDILMRSTVLRYRKVSGVWTVIDEQSDSFTANAADCEASLFYVESAVERALGDVKIFDDNGNPLYYGDVFSANLRLGGRIRRVAGVYAAVSPVV